MGSYTLAGGRMIQDDDDVQFLYQAAPKAFPCQICNMDLSRQTEHQRQAHYELHFSESAEASGSHVETSNQRTGSNTGTWMKVRETDVFWFPAQTKLPPANFSPGLIPVLRKALIKSHARGKTQRAVLCYDRTVYISRELWDATWGCGYRNFLMACTALMDQPMQPMYSSLLNDPASPSVRNLQKTIEAAWKDGYDKDGAKELKNKLVGTNKWIGTAEIYTAFIYRRIPAGLIDFEHKNQETVVKSVTDWVVQYFSPPLTGSAKISVDDALRGASPVTCTDKMPMILQHNGHSRLIVGYEVSRNGMVNLLTFDPSKKPNKSLRNAGLATLSSTLAPSSNKQSLVSSSVIQNILRPIHKNKRREIDESSSNDNRTKRPRSEPRENMSDDEVIIVDGPSSARHVNPIPKQQGNQRTVYVSEDDPIEIVSFFKLDPKKLGRKKEYQILYFPLSEPLSQKEQLARKEVRSTNMC